MGPGVVIGALALVAGAFLVARPDESGAGYRVLPGAVRPDHGAAGTAADPLFRSWSEGVRARMRRDPAPEPEPARELHEGASTGRARPAPGEGYDAPPGVDGVTDPWAVLGISPDTPMEHVTRRWKRLCKRYHPDVVPRGLQAETLEAVKKINAAYQVIRESHRRKGAGS